MKRTNVNFLIAAALVLVSLPLVSCNDGDDYYWPDFYPNATVTVKTTETGRLFLQLDDRTTLLPVNLTTSPFDGKEVRALTNYRSVPQDSGEYDEAVHVNWIDSIRTKAMVPFVEGRNDDLYGSEPIEIVDDRITSVEDGYLTLHLRMPWYDPNIKHHINLLTGGNPDDPYEVELRHDAKGDGCVRVSDAYIAFRLDGLPDTGGETVKLRLTWRSSRGIRRAEFDYRTGN
jgi:hypothetical protein